MSFGGYFETAAVVYSRKSRLVVTIVVDTTPSPAPLIVFGYESFCGQPHLLSLFSLAPSLYPKSFVRSYFTVVDVNPLPSPFDVRH